MIYSSYAISKHPCDVVFTCLNKNVIFLYEEAFRALGNGKLLFNTSIGPAFVPSDLKNWLDVSENNYFICDTKGAIGDTQLEHPPRVLLGLFGRTHPPGIRFAKSESAG